MQSGTWPFEESIDLLACSSRQNCCLIRMSSSSKGFSSFNIKVCALITSKTSDAVPIRPTAPPLSANSASAVWTAPALESKLH